MRKERLVSLGLSCLMAAGAVFGVSGCDREKASEDQNVIIAGDSTWYDVEEIVFEKPETDELDYCSYDIVSFSNGGIYARFEGVTRSLYQPVRKLVKLDSSGKILESKNYSDMLGEYHSYEYIPELVGVFENDDNCQVLLSEGDVNFNSGEYYLYDTAAKSCSTFSLADLEQDGDIHTIISVLGLEKGEYAVIKSTFGWNDAGMLSDYDIVVGGPNEIHKTLNVGELIGENKYFLITGATSKDGLIFLECYFDETRETINYSIDINTKQVTKEATISTSGVESSIADDGRSYYVTDSGIYDSSEEETPVISFDDCNIIRSYMEGMHVIHMDEQECVLIGNVFDEENYDYSIKGFRLTKSATNPNEGKRILTMGYMDELPFLVERAVYEFNGTDTEYFITLTDKYLGDSVSRYEYVMDGNLSSSNQSNSELIDSLAMDLLSGTAPDIIYGAHDYIQFKNDQYLTDLAPYLEGRSDLFSNVIDASKYGGKLYAMPLAFLITGISAETDDVGADRVGFTFDEYAQVVNEVCNGTDPLSFRTRTRLDYFQLVYEAMADQFYDDDGNINLHDQAFYDLAAYCRDHVPEGSQISDADNDFGDDCFGATFSVSYSSIGDIEEFISATTAKGKFTGSLYGLPSCDGRGPVIDVTQSVAITSSCTAKDGAWKFIEILISEDVQEEVDRLQANPISVTACRTISEDYKKANADEYDRCQSENIPGYYLYPSDSIDVYIETIRSATSSNNSDPAINMIVLEEIQSYFSGQKSIEDVTDTIQNRADTVISERSN